MKSLTLFQYGYQCKPFVRVIETSKKFIMKVMILELINMINNFINYKNNYATTKNFFNKGGLIFI